MASDEEFLTNEEEDEEDEDDEEEKSLIRHKSYARHLPELLKLATENKPNLVTDRTEKCCAVCPTMQWFKGWKALLAHAETFKKKRIHQHRGYAEAIKEAVRRHGTSNAHSEGTPAATRTASFDPETASNHLIVWPPIVVVKSYERGNNLKESLLGLLHKEVPNVQLPYFVDADGSTGLLVFRTELIGYLEAKQVAKMFSELWRQGDLWVKGYLADPEDMKKIDPERKLVKWTKESYYQRVQHAQKKDKEEHDNEKARLKEIEMQVVSLGEDELKSKERREGFQRLIESKQSEIENHRKKAEELEKDHHDKMQRLEAHFQTDIKIVEATTTARLKRYREHLQENEKRLEEERKKRMKEIESLQKQFQSIKQDIKQQEAQKALDKELEIMQRVKNFMAETAKAEARFNEIARNQESELQEKQYLEKMKLMEETKREREKVLKECLAKQQKEKKQEAPPPQEEVTECFLCKDPLDESNRAFFHPCGHAKSCLECALEIFKETRSCPICRNRITKKPKLIPKMYT